MFVGMIIAGDDEVEATILFETRTEAEDKMAVLLRDYYRADFDRVVVAPVEKWDDVINEAESAKQEYYNELANENPTGYIAGQEPWK